MRDYSVQSYKMLKIREKICTIREYRALASSFRTVFFIKGAAAASDGSGKENGRDSNSLDETADNAANFYDPQKNFYDNISCDALEKRKGYVWGSVRFLFRRTP